MKFYTVLTTGCLIIGIATPLYAQKDMNSAMNGTADVTGLMNGLKNGSYLGVRAFAEKIGAKKIINNFSTTNVAGDQIVHSTHNGDLLSNDSIGSQTIISTNGDNNTQNIDAGSATDGNTSANISGVSQ
jgi:hypothetical protein